MEVIRDPILILLGMKRRDYCLLRKSWQLSLFSGIGVREGLSCHDRLVIWITCRGQRKDYEPVLVLLLKKIARLIETFNFSLAIANKPLYHARVWKLLKICKQLVA